MRCEYIKNLFIVFFIASIKWKTLVFIGKTKFFHKKEFFNKVSQKWKFEDSYYIEIFNKLSDNKKTPLVF